MSKFPADAPLRLAVALKEAFPAGGMTVSGLRREAAKGRLAIEVIAGKQFTTLAAIARMRELCCAPAREQAVSVRDAQIKSAKTSQEQDGSSLAAGMTAQAALRTKLQQLRQNSVHRSRGNAESNLATVGKSLATSPKTK